MKAGLSTALSFKRLNCRSEVARRSEWATGIAFQMPLYLQQAVPKCAALAHFKRNFAKNCGMCHGGYCRTAGIVLLSFMLNFLRTGVFAMRTLINVYEQVCQLTTLLQQPCLWLLKLTVYQTTRCWGFIYHRRFKHNAAIESVILELSWVTNFSNIFSAPSLVVSRKKRQLTVKFRIRGVFEMTDWIVLPTCGEKLSFRILCFFGKLKYVSLDLTKFCKRPQSQVVVFFDSVYHFAVR